LSINQPALTNQKSLTLTYIHGTALSPTDRTDVTGRLTSSPAQHFLPDYQPDTFSITIGNILYL